LEKLSGPAFCLSRVVLFLYGQMDCSESITAKALKGVDSMFMNNGNGNGDGDRLLEQRGGKLLDQDPEGFSFSSSERLPRENCR
jgi:hypothetical protein